MVGKPSLVAALNLANICIVFFIMSFILLTALFIFNSRLSINWEILLLFMIVIIEIVAAIAIEVDKKIVVGAAKVAVRLIKVIVSYL